MATLDVWIHIVNEALKELGADEVLTRGAPLRQQVEELARARGEDLGDFLEKASLKFGELVSKDPGIEVHRRLGTDMYVGLKGADWPPEAERTKPHAGHTSLLRSDVYEAFTRISDRAFYYVPNRDVFAQNLDEETRDTSIPVPQVTLEDLLAERRAFAEEQLVPESRDDLLRSIDRSATH